MKAGRRSRTVIGIDIGRRTIKAAQLRFSKGHYGVSALSLLPRPEAEKEVCCADALALKKVLKRQGFSGNRIVLAAREKDLLRAALELPSKVSGAPIAQIVRMELSRLHNVPPNAFEMAHWELKTPDGSKPMTQTLAIGCLHDGANAFLDIFEDCGFNVTALDVRSAAATRACETLVLPPPEITAIVDLGWRATSVLFVCGRSLIYERALEGASVAELIGKLTEAFGIPLESAYQVINTVGLTAEDPTGQFDRETVEVIRKHLWGHFDRFLEELKVPFSYANHQFPGEGITRLLLIGGGAGVPQLAAHIGDRLGIEVKAAAPSDLIESPPALLVKAGNPAMTVAVGLARFDGA